MNYWYEKNSDYNELVEKVRELFWKNNIKEPERLLPTWALPKEDPMEVFLFQVNSLCFRKVIDLKRIINRTELQQREYEYYQELQERFKQ